MTQARKCDANNDYRLPREPSTSGTTSTSAIWSQTTWMSSSPSCLRLCTKTQRAIGTGMLLPLLNILPLLFLPYHMLTLPVSLHRTIHGMVYNAMKLFMEVNPQLFDECSHEYTEQQNNAEAVKQNRQAKWDRLAALAEQMKSGGGANGTTAGGTGGIVAPAVQRPSTSRGNSSVGSPLREGDGDPLSQESSRRMEQLRLQDDQRGGGGGGGGGRKDQAVR